MSTDNIKIENLTKFAYSEFCSHYSKRNWLSNEPLWNELDEKDKLFWKNFILGIKSDFNNKPEEVKKITTKEQVEKVV